MANATLGGAAGSAGFATHGRETATIQGPKLRQLVTALTGQHNGNAPVGHWSPIRIARFSMPKPDAPGVLGLVWLRDGAPPRPALLGEVRAVGNAVIEVTGISQATTVTLADLRDGAGATEAEFRTLTPVRWGRRTGDHDIDVLVPREELIVTGLIHEWASIAHTDGSAPPVPDAIARTCSPMWCWSDIAACMSSAVWSNGIPEPGLRTTAEQ